MSVTDDPIVDLRDAVDALTKPVHITYLQLPVESADRNGRREGTVRAHDPSLLEQLREAISNSIGERSAGGRAPRERTPMDVAAFTLYEQIDGRVRSWLVDVGVQPAKADAPGEILRSWFPLWKVARKEDAAIVNHTVILKRWEAAITDLLISPPSKEELTVRCPSCKAMWATVGQGEETESVRALWAVWKENRDNCYAVCRNCDQVWMGVPKMRQLRIAIDDDEAEQAARKKLAELMADPELSPTSISALPNSGQEVTAI